MIIKKFTFPIFFLFCVFCSHKGNGQALNKNFLKENLFVGAKVHYGFIISHRESMSYLVSGHVPMFELTFDDKVDGHKPWHHIFRFPYVGFAFHYADFGNQKQLGQAIGAYPYLNFPLGKPKERWNSYFRFGSGLCYITKCFDRVDNYKNTAIGSHLNVLINFNLESELRVSPRWYVKGGISFTHYSNGASKLPNLGLNVPTLNIGTLYKLCSEPCLTRERILPELHKKIEYSLFFAMGLKELYPAGGPKYGSYTFSVNVARNYNLKGKLGAGMELFYDQSLKKKLESEAIPVKSNAETIRSGAYVAHELAVGKLSFIFHIGFYVYDKWKVETTVYNRIGLRYDISKHLVANLSLKTHYAKADFVEYGFGYKF